MKLWETDYRIPMLSNNNVNGLLPTKVHYENGQVDFYYEISSKQSLDRIVEKISMDYTRLKRLIKDVKKVLQELELYLLPEDGLLLRPEYIFMNINNVIGVHNYLAGLELSKFDKDVRSAVRKNYVATHKVVKDFEDTQEVLKKKCFEGQEEIQQKVQDLRARFQKAATSEEKAAIEAEGQSDEFMEYF